MTTETRMLTCVLKVPEAIQLQYSANVMGTNPDRSINGMLATVWEYDIDVGDAHLDSVTAKQHILESLQNGLAMVPTDEYPIEKIAGGIRDAVVKCEFTDKPNLNDELDDSIFQASIADMSQADYDEYNKPLDGLKFKFTGN